MPLIHLVIHEADRVTDTQGGRVCYVLKTYVPKEIEKYWLIELQNIS